MHRSHSWRHIRLLVSFYNCHDCWKPLVTLSWVQPVRQLKKNAVLSGNSSLKLQKAVWWKPVGSFFSEPERKDYDLGSVTSDNAPVGPTDETEMNTCTKPTPPHFYNESVLVGAILFPKGALMLRRCVTARQLRFGFACLIFHAHLLQ